MPKPQKGIEDLLGYMRPTLPQNCEPDSVVVESEPLGDIGNLSNLASEFRSDLTDKVCVEHRIMGSLTDRRIRFSVRSAGHSLLDLRVSHVLSMSTQEKMIESDAWWIIATMANFHSIGNFPVRKNPSHSVGKHRPFGLDEEYPVPIEISTVCPLMASISNRHLQVESILDRRCADTVDLASFLTRRCLREEGATAFSTRSWWSRCQIMLPSTRIATEENWSLQQATSLNIFLRPAEFADDIPSEFRSTTSWHIHSELRI